jgi:hypothetical protein
MWRQKRALAAALGACAALGLGANGTAWADAGGVPAQQANCIGAANSGGSQGAFVSGQATTLPPGEFGANTAEAFGHGTIGEVASSNDCG